MHIKYATRNSDTKETRDCETAHSAPQKTRKENLRKQIIVDDNISLKWNQKF